MKNLLSYFSSQGVNNVQYSVNFVDVLNPVILMPGHSLINTDTVSRYPWYKIVKILVEYRNIIKGFSLTREQTWQVKEGLSFISFSSSSKTT